MSSSRRPLAPSDAPQYERDSQVDAWTPAKPRLGLNGPDASKLRAAAMFQLCYRALVGAIRSSSDIRHEEHGPIPGGQNGRGV
jgi:hypothetical protein